MIMCVQVYYGKPLYGPSSRKCSVLRRKRNSPGGAKYARRHAAIGRIWIWHCGMVVQRCLPIATKNVTEWLYTRKQHYTRVPHTWRTEHTDTTVTWSKCSFVQITLFPLVLQQADPTALLHFSVCRSKPALFASRCRGNLAFSAFKAPICKNVISPGQNNSRALRCTVYGYTPAHHLPAQLHYCICERFARAALCYATPRGRVLWVHGAWTVRCPWRWWVVECDGHSFCTLQSYALKCTEPIATQFISWEKMATGNSMTSEEIVAACRPYVLVLASEDSVRGVGKKLVVFAA